MTHRGPFQPLPFCDSVGEFMGYGWSTDKSRDDVMDGAWGFLETSCLPLYSLHGRHRPFVTVAGWEDPLSPDSPLLFPSASLPTTGTSTPQHDCPSDDETTLILDLEPPGERCQLHGGLPTRLPAHHKTCAPVSDPSGGRGHVCPDQGGDMSPTQPAPPVLPMQRDKQAEEVSGSAHGDTVPLPRSIQDSLASLREDFSGWTRSNVQQAGELLKISNRLLQAQRRANSHLISVTREIRAMSRSLATIASTVAPLLQPVATPRDPPTAEMEWPSLPSDLLELFPPNTPQQHEPLVPAAAAAPSTTRRPPANPPTSPVLSEPSSPASEGECPRSRHPARSKRGGKPSTRLQKRRKK